MSKELNKSDKAFKRREEFIRLHGAARLFEIKILYQMHKHKDWEVLGFESFDEYVKAPVNSGGLSISRAWATQLVKAYEKFVEELGLPPGIFTEVSPRKLYLLKDMATSKNVKDIIEKARSQTLEDLTKEKKGIMEADCVHEPGDIFIRCRRCGSFLLQQ